MRIPRLLLLSCCVCLTAPLYGDAIASYTFNSTLAAQQSGVAPLVAVDPQSVNGYQTSTVFGNQQTTYHFGGAASPATDQGGLDLDITGLVSSNTYSVEMVVELAGASGSFRRLLDSSDRQSDLGLYIGNHNNLLASPGAGPNDLFSPNTFYDILVTVGSGTVTGYLSGVQQFSGLNPNLNLASHTLAFFLDNSAGSNQSEWSSGNVALIKIFNTALTSSQVATEVAATMTPEPGSLLLIFTGIAGVAILRRKA